MLRLKALLFGVSGVPLANPITAYAAPNKDLGPWLLLLTLQRIPQRTVSCYESGTAFESPHYDNV
jgi:hypothetical protein